MRLLLFTRSLNSGGAERQLTLLAQTLRQRGITVAVMVFYGWGPYRQDLERAGVEVINLEKSGRWDVVGCLWRAVGRIKTYQPDLIYSFIGTGVIAALLKPFFSRVKLVWSVRSSEVDFSSYSWFDRVFDKANVPFSRFADAIICNSEAGRRHVIEQGFRPEAVSVVPNGFDTAKFRFDPSSRALQRAAWGVSKGECLIGLVARLDPLKDHKTFVEAAAHALVERKDLRFICVGEGDDLALEALQAYTVTYGIADRLIWAGYQVNLSAVYSAIDVLVLSSVSDGFPNVIGEGMSCGLPVVATDVGDCRAIIAHHGWLVPPKDAVTLAKGILQAVDALEAWDKNLPRLHIAEKYSIESMVDSTLSILERVQAG